MTVPGWREQCLQSTGLQTLPFVNILSTTPLLTEPAPQWEAGGSGQTHRSVCPGAVPGYLKWGSEHGHSAIHCLSVSALGISILNT